MAKRRRKRRSAVEPVGTLDFETDPFLAGRVPKPFACCVYFGKDDFALLWESDSRERFIKRVVKYLRKLPACVLYAHNGGKFDFHYLIDEADKQTLQVRNGRLVELRIGKVLLKDSFPLMPFALEEYRKTPINYALFEKRRRKKHREKISDYLIDDCANLLELVQGFRAIVGPRDTIGSAAFYQMRELGLEIWHANETHDENFRRFYFGGRVEDFEQGIFKGPIQYLDINSAYPRAMMEEHAHGPDYVLSKRLPRKLGRQFITLIAESRGSLPIRTPSGELSFPHEEGEFNATGWEVAAGLATKTLTIKKIIEVWEPQSTICFRDFVETFFAKRANAKATGDKIGALAYKYLLNSGYGKFAQNPRDFKDYFLAPIGKRVRGYDWELDFGAMSLWSRPNFKGWGFYDVATAASITGFVRAMLWTAIRSSKGVLYCDTDSILCRAAKLDMGSALGAWKLEGIASRVAIAGKKLYAVEWQKPKKGEPRYKIASKGARLSFREMLDICGGKAIIWRNAAPTFSLGNPHFIQRKIRAT